MIGVLSSTTLIEFGRCSVEPSGVLGVAGRIAATRD
jgi:hypothetical protein